MSSRGRIFLGKCDLQKLAEEIIQGAIDQFAQCQSLQEIIFVDYNKNPIKYFEKAILGKFAQEINDNWKGKVSILAGGGDIKDKNKHGAEAVVNAANINVKFGRGISGIISSETGNPGAIDQKARGWIREFYLQQKGISNGTSYEEPKRNQKQPLKTCTFCSKTFPAGSGIEFNKKDYCSNECSLKQQEKSLPSKPNENNSLAQVRSRVISDIRKSLNYEPKITNSDLSTDYQNWENIINQNSSESQINDFHQKVLKDIMEKRRTEREIVSRDEKINQAHTLEEKVNLLGEMGSSLGEHTPQQQVKLEQIKSGLNSVQLREGIQKEINAQMAAFEVAKKDLSSSIQNQLEQLKKENNTTKIREIEKNITQAVGGKFAEQKIISLSQKIEVILKVKNKIKLQELKDELLKIINSPNSFLQAKKTQFQNLLQKLEKEQKPQNTPSSNQPEFPWKVAIPVSLVIVAAGIIGLVIILRRKKFKSQKPK